MAAGNDTVRRGPKGNDDAVPLIQLAIRKHLAPNSLATFTAAKHCAKDIDAHSIDATAFRLAKKFGKDKVFYSALGRCFLAISIATKLQKCIVRTMSEEQAESFVLHSVEPSRIQAYRTRALFSQLFSENPGLAKRAMTSFAALCCEINAELGVELISRK